MVSLIGTYQNGYLKLDKEYATTTPVKVIVTFLEEVENSSSQGMSLTDFSFAKSRENLKSFDGSFSEAVVAERRAEL
jgi:hypothetical protein